MTDVADGYAGQTCSCAHCGKPVNIPSGGGARSKRRRSLWLNPLVLFFLLIIGCDTIGMLISQFLPALQAAREAKRRVQCVENLKQIGLAMQGYHQQYGCFPPAFIPDKNGKPMHSWRVLMLPFLEQDALYHQYRFDEPWNGPHNKALADHMPSVYRCPSSDPTPDPSQTSYAMIVGPHAISDGPTPHRMSDIKDGASNTIMVAEAAKAAINWAEAASTGINWMEPRDLNAENMDFCTRAVEKDLRRETCEIFRNHNVAANVLFCDGSVRTLSNELLYPKELEALMTIDGGERVRGEEDRTAR